MCVECPRVCRVYKSVHAVTNSVLCSLSGTMWHARQVPSGCHLARISLYSCCVCHCQLAVTNPRKCWLLSPVLTLFLCRDFIQVCAAFVLFADPPSRHSGTCVLGMGGEGVSCCVRVCMFNLGLKVCVPSVPADLAAASLSLCCVHPYRRSCMSIYII